MMPSLSAKIFDVFKIKHLKSDAVPNPPRRPPKPEKNIDDVNEESLPNDENFDTYNIEENVSEPEDFDTEKAQKPKKDKKRSKSPQHENQSVINNVNTQASGPVINIVGSRDIHWGHVFVNQTGAGPSMNTQQSTNPQDVIIKKSKLIIKVMKAKIQVDEVYIQYTSENLGKNWHSIFRKLGYTQGRIETFEMDSIKTGVSEARYKLLLDWQRNSDDPTLGHLATLLWEEGERQVVKGLADLYHKSQN